MIRKIISPFQKFIKAESLAGFLLFGATILALIMANTSFNDIYLTIKQFPIGFSFGDFELKKPLILWINDGLMAVFFFLIGLELKRELLVGELNSLKRAAFPFIAALGGVIIPIVLFLMINQQPDTSKAWGIPMATDIAFALAVLMLLGKRVPLSLKIFLTAFAIIDDLAAVLVIALFYSQHIYWELLAYALVLIGLLAWFYRKKTFRIDIGLFIAIIVWILFLKSGIHPTIAGVLLAFAIPIKKKININVYVEKLNFVSQNLLNKTNPEPAHILNKDEMNCINYLGEATAEARSPLQYLEEKLHGLIAYFILPVFAFANAGINFASGLELNTALVMNIALALFIGKLSGISLFTFAGVKLKLIKLPDDLNYKHIIGIGAIAGIGFTMSIFIANLAFQGNDFLINSAKIGIIIGSLTAGLTGYLILRFVK